MSEQAAHHRSARQLRIRGRVQGVWYRASSCQEALRLGLHGWVRNRHDGSVEAHVIGAPAAIEAFIAWARVGPPQAMVEEVQVTEVVAETLSGFEQRPSA